MSTHEREDTDETVGSLGEEAVRLLGALSGWMTHHGADVQRHADEAVRRTVEEVGHLAEGFEKHCASEKHCATGAPECTWCPVCRAVHVVRSVSPEVRTHLSAAVVSLGRAAAALLATPPPSPSSSASPGSTGDPSAPFERPADPGPEDATSERVQRIRLDDDTDPSAT